MARLLAGKRGAWGLQTGASLGSLQFPSSLAGHRRPLLVVGFFSTPALWVLVRKSYQTLGCPAFLGAGCGNGAWPSQPDDPMLYFSANQVFLHGIMWPIQCDRPEL